MLTRREMLIGAAAAAASCSTEREAAREAPAAAMSGRERVDRALEGRDLDRPPFTFYYHFGLEKYPAERHAEATLEFHRKFRTDLVKVMSDFPYPRPDGEWHELSEVENPYPEEIRALEIIRDGLDGEAHFIETIFNPWNVAEKLSSKEEVRRLKDEKPQALLDALETIANSEANHARRALEAGASGVFLAIANAQESALSESDYARFSEPFDKIVLAAAAGAPLNTLHLHGEGVYLKRFQAGWPAASVIQYSLHGTGVPFAEFRDDYDGVLMGGLDEGNFRTLSSSEMETQWKQAQPEAGAKFILAPGCSVPNDTSDEELMRLVDLLGA